MSFKDRITKVPEGKSRRHLKSKNVEDRRGTVQEKVDHFEANRQRAYNDIQRKSLNDRRHKSNPKLRDKTPIAKQKDHLTDFVNSFSRNNPVRKERHQDSARTLRETSKPGKFSKTPTKTQVTPGKWETKEK